MILAYSLKRTSLIWQQERCQVDQTNLEQRSQCQKLSLEQNEVNFFAFQPIIDKYRVWLDYRIWQSLFSLVACSDLETWTTASNWEKKNPTNKNIETGKR